MSIFVTSDTHFGHANIIKYCDRPFKSVTDMNESIIKAWNRMVRPEDTIYHLGDFAFLNQLETAKIIEQLNGKIKIVPGNHDKTIRALGDSEHYTGFELLDSIVEIHLDGTMFVLCHFPIESWHRKEHGSIHLHGHSHGHSITMTNRFDIGVDVYGKPVKLTADCTNLLNPTKWETISTD